MPTLPGLVRETHPTFATTHALLAREIPCTQQVLLVGHMTALETPKLTRQAILAFLDALPRSTG